MIFKGQNLVILAMKMKGNVGESEYIPTLIEIITDKFHDSKNFIIPTKVPDIVFQTETIYPKMYRFDYSPLFIKDGYVYFGIGNPIDKEYGIRFFRYKEGKAEYVAEFGNIDSYRSPYLIGFRPTSENKFLLAYAAYFSKKLTIATTDAFLQPQSEKQTKLSAYPDFNQLLEMPNGKLVVLSVNKNDHWSYMVFDKSGELLSEIETSASEKLHPSLFKIIKDNAILSSFYKNNNDEPTLLQEVIID
ncbi:MAG: hypothetical protein QM710_02120 [Flavobacterium sp.]